MDSKILDSIIRCDGRYRGHTSDGKIEMELEGDVITMTREEFLESNEIGTDEVFYATVDVFLADIGSTSIVSTNATVDVLLDLRRLFQVFREEQKQARRILCRAAFGSTEDESEEHDLEPA